MQILHSTVYNRYTQYAGKIRLDPIVQILHVPSVRSKLPALDPRWINIARAVAPSGRDCLKLLKRLTDTAGRDNCAMLLGVPVHHVDTWNSRARNLSWQSRRLIWLTYTLLFEPERVRSLFDFVTWCRFTPRTTRGKPEDWSGWEV